MLGTFVDKLSGFFGRRFIIAFWSPSCICLGVFVGLVGVLLGPEVVYSWWSHLDGTEKALLIGVILLAITLMAYLLEAISVPLTNFFEGYWPQKLLTLWKRNSRLYAAKKNNPDEAKHAYTVRSQIFPRDPELLKPTRLGNVLAAVNEYSYTLYRLEAFIWWPRLSPLLPESFRTQVDTSLTPMQAMLNLSTIFCLLAIGGASLLIDQSWTLFFTVGLSGLILARMCYLAAVNQAITYGVLVRVAFDFYRHEILKQMHVPVPDNLVEERLLWNTLNSVVDEQIMPWEDDSETTLVQLASPFYYDTHQHSIHILKRKWDE